MGKTFWNIRFTVGKLGSFIYKGIFCIFMKSYCWRKTNRVNYAKVQLEYDGVNIYIKRNNATDFCEETEHGKSLFTINEILNHLGHKRKDIQNATQ